MQERYISLAHGNGGQAMRALIETLFIPHLGAVDTTLDAAPLPSLDGNWRITTDGFTVQPLEFPGGSIGSLAIHGTCNDLAVSGAEPRWLSLNVLLEEGLEIAQLARIIADLSLAAQENHVTVVAGDTKVVPRGQGGGLYLATTGLGQQRRELGLDRIQPGDALLVSGPVGDHGIAVMLAREQFGLRGNLRSDAASVLPLARAAWAIPGVRFLRDPTRGGLATVAHEIARATGFSLALQQDAIPVREPVRAVCEILGYDPLFLACEGRIVAVVEATQAATLLNIWKSLPGGAHCAQIGILHHNATSQVVLHTTLGGQRLLPELDQEPLPRIC